jgi:hypothetical protein
MNRQFQPIFQNNTHPRTKQPAAMTDMFVNQVIPSNLFKSNEDQFKQGGNSSGIKHPQMETQRTNRSTKFPHPSKRANAGQRAIPALNKVFNSDSWQPGDACSQCPSDYQKNMMYHPNASSNAAKYTCGNHNCSAQGGNCTQNSQNNCYDSNNNQYQVSMFNSD